MTYFPHAQAKRPAAPATATFGHVRTGILRDILWNQPVFKAPTLVNPRIVLDPLPFTATRVTQRATQG